MIKDDLAYFERRVAASRALVAKSSGIVRETHEKFVTAYSERIAKCRIAGRTVDELLG